MPHGFGASSRLEVAPALGDIGTPGVITLESGSGSSFAEPVYGAPDYEPRYRPGYSAPAYDAPAYAIPILNMSEASVPELHKLANTGSATPEVATSEFPGRPCLLCRRDGGRVYVTAYWGARLGTAKPTISI